MMDAPPQNLLRFLPTLTEVVNQTDLAETTVPTRLDIEEIVQTVMQRTQGQFEKRLAQEIDTMVCTLVAEQLKILDLRLRQEFELGVRQAVVEAITRRQGVQN